MRYTALHHKLAATTQHLTCREIYRLLYRYDLAPIAWEAIWDDIQGEADCLAEIAAERGTCPQPTAMERFLRANPVYGPQVRGPHTSWDPDGDVPF